MDVYESTWWYMNVNGSKWENMKVYEALWWYMNAYETRMNVYEPIWWYYESIW